MAGLRGRRQSALYSAAVAVREGNWWSRAWGAVAVLGYALLLGAAAYEAALIAPLWSLAPPDSVREWVALSSRPDSSALFQPLVAVTVVASAMAWMSGLLERGWRRWWLTLSLCGAGGLAAVTVLHILPCERDLFSAASLGERDPAFVISLTNEWIRAASLRMAALVVGGWAAYRAQLAGMLGDIPAARRAASAAASSRARPARDFAFGDDDAPDVTLGEEASPARDRWRGSLQGRRRTAKK